MWLCAVRRCFKSIWYESYLLVDLLPSFLKSFGFGLMPGLAGRRLSGEEPPAAGLETSLEEVDKLRQLTRDLNALQVIMTVAVPFYCS